MRQLVISILLLISTPGLAAVGFVSVASQNDLKRTVQLLESRAATFGFQVILKVDHNQKFKASKSSGKLLMLDHEKHESPLLELSDTIGIELPLKVFTFSDKDGQVWMTYTDPRAIAARHNISDSKEAEKLADALSSLTLVAATAKIKD